MEFVLTYEGPLPATGNAKQKHLIRRALHPQVRELWSTHPGLSESKFLLDPSYLGGSVIHQAGDFKFATLVCLELKLKAKLDILLLRPGRPGALLSSRADLDNQIKTLLDSLRAPLGINELPGEVPGPEEDPFFCLLDDDKRVTDLRVRGEQLLDPGAAPSSVQALIQVTVMAEALTPENSVLL